MGAWALVAGASDGTVAEFYRTATVDLSSVDACEKVRAAVGSREVGRFVLNAGSDPSGSRFLDAPLEAWLELVQRNSVTRMELCYHFARPMREKGRGGILRSNSAAGYRGSSFMAAYSASKGFVLNLAEALWADLHQFGVDLLSFHPNMTDTPFYRRMLGKNNLPLPPGTVSARDAATRACAMLPFGPVRNIGQENDEPGHALGVPDTLRELTAWARRLTFFARFGSAAFVHDVADGQIGARTRPPRFSRLLAFTGVTGRRF
jgi:NAD(P)-dependent dehydrogenase (short-subunit alcohol dehydrogenase family)